MNYLAIQEAIDHAREVLNLHRGSTSESLMDHVASNFPDLSDEEMDEVEQGICDRWFGGVVPRPYECEVVPPL